MPTTTRPGVAWARSHSTPASLRPASRQSLGHLMVSGAPGARSSTAWAMASPAASARRVAGTAVGRSRAKLAVSTPAGASQVLPC